MFTTYLRLGLRVDAGWRAVVRAAARSLRPYARKDPRQRCVRKRFYRAMLLHHANAQHAFTLWRL